MGDVGSASQVRAEVTSLMPYHKGFNHTRLRDLFVK